MVLDVGNCIKSRWSLVGRRTPLPLTRTIGHREAFLALRSLYIFPRCLWQRITILEVPRASEHLQSLLSCCRTRRSLSYQNGHITLHTK